MRAAYCCVVGSLCQVARVIEDATFSLSVSGKTRLETEIYTLWQAIAISMWGECVTSCLWTLFRCCGMFMIKKKTLSTQRITKIPIVNSSQNSFKSK